MKADLVLDNNHVQNRAWLGAEGGEAMAARFRGDRDGPRGRLPADRRRQASLAVPALIPLEWRPLPLNPAFRHSHLTYCRGDSR